MKEKQIELFRGVTVSKSIADWVRLMPWDSVIYSMELAITGTKGYYTNPKERMNNILGLYWDITRGIYLTGDVKSLVLTTNLDQIVLEDDKILPSYLIGSKLKLEPCYTTYRN